MKIKVVSMLFPCVDRDAKNFNGKTALSIHEERRPESDEQIGRILCSRLGLPRAVYRYLQARLEGNHHTILYIRFGNIPIVLMVMLDRIIKSILELGRGGKVELGRGGNEKSREAILVVAVLIATAAYQGILSPPGGFWQDEDSSSPGKMIMSGRLLSCYLAFNSVAFALSLGEIILNLPGASASNLLIMSATFLLLTYSVAFLNNTPEQFLALRVFVLFILAFVCVFGWMTVAQALSMARYYNPQHFMDTPEKRHIRHHVGSDEPGHESQENTRGGLSGNSCEIKPGNTMPVGIEEA
ncbi:hypothetical protein CDL15_Pgr021466 [Punica granatum]|uniref:PGG domain-containing protein n=1 Tax=Punica granatum TaxID=22663 RepID=A0A218XNJ6_PUNGR|nr:hypothetical protein CDL15_Pgr021466 [Punica granatum]PKI53547.1 hypothetical protein CRG98_026092 [Punica granatum]